MYAEIQTIAKFEVISQERLQGTVRALQISEEVGKTPYNVFARH